MEMWDGGLPMYSKGEAKKKSSKVVVGSKIIITKPDSASIERNVMNGDIGKIVHIQTGRTGLTRYLTYNPKWKCLNDGDLRGLNYSGLFIVLWRDEFEVI